MASDNLMFDRPPPPHFLSLSTCRSLPSTLNQLSYIASATVPPSLTSKCPLSVLLYNFTDTVDVTVQIKDTNQFNLQLFEAILAKTLNISVMATQLTRSRCVPHPHPIRALVCPTLTPFVHLCSYSKCSSPPLLPPFHSPSICSTTLVIQLFATDGSASILDPNTLAELLNGSLNALNQYSAYFTVQVMQSHTAVNSGMV